MATLTVVTRQLNALRREANSGSISGVRLAAFLDELELTLKAIAQVAIEAYNKK